MILRKPYAFFIKHFKLMHVLMTLLFVYLVYKSSALLGFFTSYVSNPISMIGRELTETYFSNFIFFVPFLLIIFAIIIGSVLIIKRKPFTIYIGSIVVNIATLIVYNYAFSIVETMEYRLVDIREARLVHDLMIFIFIVQLIGTVITFVRATGFDIKKFDFGKDLQALEIKDEDNEEVEVALNVDTDKAKRKLRRHLRFSKYFYLEHKFVINIVVIISIVTIAFISFFNFGVLNKTYNQSVVFRPSGFNMKINNAYITDKNYKGEVIDEFSKFVVIDLQVKSVGLNKPLPTSRASILVNGKRYYHEYIYYESFVDLGQVYNDQQLDSTEKKYLLIFQIPKSLKVETLVFSYVDQLIGKGLNPKYIKVSLNPNYINQNTKRNNYIIGEELDFKDSVLKNSKLLIQSIDIDDGFKENYNFTNNNRIYSSVEYVKKSIETSDTRTLLKLNNTFTLDEEVINKITLFDLIKDYGKIKYNIEGKEYTDTLVLKQVKPTKFATNNLYLEVNKDIKNADKIDLVLYLRNKEYIYNLKGGK